MLNLCMSEAARKPDVISEAHFKVCLDKALILSALKADLKDGDFSGEELKGHLLLLTLSGESLLFCPSTWLPEADLVRMQSAVKGIAQVGGHMVLSSLALLLSADVTCLTCLTCCHLKLLDSCLRQ